MFPPEKKYFSQSLFFLNFAAGESVDQIFFFTKLHLDPIELICEKYLKKFIYFWGREIKG